MSEAKKGTFTPEFFAGLLSPLVLLPFLGIAVVRAYVVSTLWGWYVVPGFGQQTLRPVFAYGIAMLLNYSIAHAPYDEKPKFWRNMFRAALSAGVVLLFGWLGTLFI